MMVASYLETLSTFTLDTLVKACDSYKRRSTRFAPSVGEIYERCAEIQSKAIKDSRLALESRKYSRIEPSEAERERMKKKFAALLSELRGNALT